MIQSRTGAFHEIGRGARHLASTLDKLHRALTSVEDLLTEISSDDRNATTPLQKRIRRQARYRDAISLSIGISTKRLTTMRVVSRELGIVLTSKPMGRTARSPCRRPASCLERHLRRLIARGHRVAICEQLSDAPVKAKRAAISRRDVVRIVHPARCSTRPAA